MSTRRLVESHRRLVADMGVIERLAFHLGGSPGPAALSAVDTAIVRLRTRLMDHMAHEERTVYPALTHDLGVDTVQEMFEDHQQIRHWVEALVRARSKVQPPNPDFDQLRWMLYLIAGLVNLHLTKEEVAYVRLARRHMAPAASTPTTEGVPT